MRQLLMLLSFGLLLGAAGCSQQSDSGQSENGDAFGEASGESPRQSNASRPGASQAGQSARQATNQAADNAAKGTFQWETKSHDFGKLKTGDVVKHKYEFTNTGKAPLKIERVKPSCGCTAPNYSKDPIPPGGKGFVTLQFDSKGKKGVQNKTATVFSNGQQRAVKLSFSAEVGS